MKKKIKFVKRQEIDYDKKSFTGLNYYSFKTKNLIGNYDSKVWLPKYIDEYKRLEQICFKLQQKLKGYQKINNLLSDELCNSIEWNGRYESEFYHYNVKDNSIANFTFNSNKTFSYIIYSSRENLNMMQNSRHNILYANNIEKYKSFNDKLDIIIEWQRKIRNLLYKKSKFFSILNFVLKDIIEYKIKVKELKINSEGMIDILINNRKYFVSVKSSSWNEARYEFNLQEKSNIYSLNL